MYRYALPIIVAILITNCGVENHYDLNSDIHPDNNTKSGLVRNAEIHLEWTHLNTGSVTDASNHLEFKVETLLCPNTRESLQSVDQCEKIKDFEMFQVKFGRHKNYNPSRTIVLTEREISEAAGEVDYHYNTHFGAFRLAFILTEVDGVSMNDRLIQLNQTLQQIDVNKEIHLVDHDSAAKATVVIRKVVEPESNRRENYGDGGIKAQAVPAQHTPRSSSRRSSSSSDSSSGGFGMTYDGKPGIDLGGGIIMDFDGDIGIGFGF